MKKQIIELPFLFENVEILTTPISIFQYFFFATSIELEVLNLVPHSILLASPGLSNIKYMFTSLELNYL